MQPRKGCIKHFFEKGCIAAPLAAYGGNSPRWDIERKVMIKVVEKVTDSIRFHAVKPLCGSSSRLRSFPPFR